MKLKVLGSNSSGNCYLVQSGDGDTLIVDCGVHFDQVKQSLWFDFSKVSGAVVTHSHGDHRKGLKDAMSNGINCYMSKETAQEIGIENHHRVIEMEAKRSYSIGGFTVMPFDLKHDVRCFGFLIFHKDMGKTCFITDTYYIPYKFPGMNNVIVEANYSQDIVDRKIADKKFLRDRILQSHMEISTTIEFLQANDLSDTNKIILIHLSDSNSDAKLFQDTVEMVTQKETYVADAGSEIDISLNPF